MQAQGVLFGQIAAVFGIVIAGVWGATQWTAAALGYQLRLGSPWFDLFGTPVYPPWKLFEWIVGSVIVFSRNVAGTLPTQHRGAR